MTNQSTALTVTPPAGSIFNEMQAFENAQRRAKALACSDLIPPAYQGQKGLANCLVALEISGRMRMSPLLVMQNLHIIHGRPSWSSAFLIGMANDSGKFSPLRFVFDNPDNPTSCYAIAKDLASGEELRGTKITLEMAKREGWSTKGGSKWQTMPEHMLRLRAGAFWVRTFCPEISLGLQTQEEVIDVEVAVASNEARESRKPVKPATQVVVDDEISAPNVAAEPKPMEAEVVDDDIW